MNKNGANMIVVIILTAFITTMICYITFKLSSYTEILNGQKEEISLSGDIQKLLKRNNLQSKITRVKSIIDDSFLYEYDEEKMIDGAIKGMLEALDDPYAAYYNEKDFKSFYTQTEGEYVGIGIYVSYDEDKSMPIVLVPLEGSPALEAGIKPGDYIEYVDDVKAYEVTYDEIVDAIKGKSGTKAKIGIIRKNEEKDEYERFEYEIVRQKIELNPIKTEIYNNNIGYIKLTSFDEASYHEFASSLETLLGNPKVKALIIDLRDNPGGVLSVCASITEKFVPVGRIVYTVDKQGNEEVIESKTEGINIPLAVLVNENSASASEVFTAAIKDYGVGIIIGKTTYGKGVVQTLKPIQDGTYMKFTTSEYFSPKGNKINGVGVKPDIEVDLPNDIENIYKIEYEKDTQLQRAILELIAKI